MANKDKDKEKSSSQTPAWRPTTVMIMRDLSRDDDFLSAMLVESLGTEDTPLTVHKMDPARKVPSFDPQEVLAIVRKHIVLKQPERGGNRVRHAVDALLQLQAVRTYLRGKNERQRNAFATHASRYFELYLPHGSVEIAHTTRYRHKTGKSELCIIATKPLAVGTVITDLKGSLADLTPEEDESLRRKDSRNSLGIRRDFSVIYSRQRNTSHLFLGPARFVNHDCEHNVQLFRDGRYITFRVIKPIEQGQEITAHYGNSYFGRKNKDCLCETCEKKGKGGYAPRVEGVDDVSESDISESSEIDRSRRFWDAAEQEGKLNLHVRKTRRGTYALDKRASTSALAIDVASASATPAAPATPSLSATPAAPGAASASATPAAEPIDVEMELEVEVEADVEKVVEAVNVTPAVSVLSELPTLSSLSSPPSEQPTRAPTPEPLPPPPRAITPTVDVPMPDAPSPFSPVDLDAYKPDALTAHFPPGLVRLTHPETIARLVLRRDDMNARASTRGLPHPSLHPLLAAAEHYPKFPPGVEPNTHFIVSSALVDPRHATFDFFDCGRMPFPHDLVELDVKQKVCEIVLLRQDLGRRSDWRGLPWPEWCPALLNPAIKAGRYPKFPPVEKRGEPPRYYASRALVEAWWGVPAPLEAPLPVGSDVPRQQLEFLTDVEWAHISAEPEMFGLTHESTWEGLPWPETAPALLAAAKAKRYPVFPEIDDRGAPPVMRADRTYAVFERGIRKTVSNATFAHTFEAYKGVWRLDALPRTYEVPRATWERIRAAPDEFGLHAGSDWRGLPWPESAPALADAQRRGAYPAFPPVHLRGAQPRSLDGERFVVFDRAFAAPEPGALLESEVETGSATTTARASTAPTSVGTPSPKKKGKGKEREREKKEDLLLEVLDKEPRCINPVCRKILVAGGNGVVGAGGILGAMLGTECHRCRRHSLIYGSPWPKRIPPPGMRLRSPTPSSSSESESEIEEEPAPPPPPLPPKGKKRPAPSATPTSTPQPPAKKRRDERMLARNKAREDAERAEQDQLAMQRAMKRYREAMREEEERYRAAKRARWEDERRPPPRLSTVPTPTFYARKREEEVEEAENMMLPQAPPRRVCWRMPKRLGGLGGALNPSFFARRRVLAAHTPDSEEDDSTKVDEQEEPASSPSPMPMEAPQRALPPMPVIRIPVPPWMEDAGVDGDDEMPATLLVEVVRA